MNPGSYAARSIAEDILALFLTELTSQNVFRYSWPHITFKKAKQFCRAVHFDDLRAQSPLAFGQGLADRFGFRFTGHFGHFRCESLDFTILDVQSHITILLDDGVMCLPWCIDPEKASILSSSAAAFYFRIGLCQRTFGKRAKSVSAV